MQNSFPGSRKAIGGGFELKKLTLGGHERLSTLTFGLAGTWTASGRSALALVLRHLARRGVTHVHLPSYLCRSILLPVQELGLEYSFYRIDGSLRAHPDPPLNAAVVLIHYFGWKNPATDMLRKEVGKSFYLIEDASHALLSDFWPASKKDHFVVFSARKFGPVPLGGWCSISEDLDHASPEMETLTWRSLCARLVRGSYLTEAQSSVDPKIENFYLEIFRYVEEVLDQFPLRSSVPKIALDIIAGLDWKAVKQKRRENWRLLNGFIGEEMKVLTPKLTDDVVPLGYVVRLNERDRVRSQLANHRIFCAVHWPLPSEIDVMRFPEAEYLAQTSLTIPIDQRYGLDDMKKVADVLRLSV